MGYKPFINAYDLIVSSIITSEVAHNSDWVYINNYVMFSLDENHL